MKRRTTLVCFLAILSGFASANIVPLQAETILEKIKKTGTITLGVRDSSGLGYLINGGKYVGFHTEMAEHIIQDLSKTVGQPIKINYFPITSANRIPLLQNGTYDFECGSTTNNRARSMEAAFAYTTYIEEVRIAVKKDSGINSLTDLKDKTIATTTGTTAVQTLRNKKRAMRLNFNEITAKDHVDAFLLLESGRADAFVMDSSILAANIAKSTHPDNYIILDDVLSIEPIACMLPLKDEIFKTEVNRSIIRQIQDGSLSKLYHKWFMEPVPPSGAVLNLPLSESTKEAWGNPTSKSMEDYTENKR